MHRSYLYPHNPTFGALSWKGARFFCCAGSARFSQHKTKPRSPSVFVFSGVCANRSCDRLHGAHRPDGFAVRHERLQLILKAHGSRILGRLLRAAARRTRALLEPRLTRACMAACAVVTRLVRLRLFDGQIDPARLIDADNLDLDLLPLLQEVLDVIDEGCRNLRVCTIPDLPSGSATNAPNLVIPVTLPSTIVPTAKSI